MRRTTTRLTLREWRPTDAASLHAFESDPKVAALQSYEPKTLAQCETYITDMIALGGEEPRVIYDLAIEHRAEVVGRVGMRRCDHENLQGALWYVVAPRVWGTGIATEATREVVDFAFGELGLHRLYADCDPENAASRRVVEKLGFRLEAHHIANAWFKGRWCDSLILAMLQSDWDAAR